MGFQLVRLSIIGSSLRPATLNFGPDITVVYGASDTGKSYIASALNYVLGGSSIKVIPEADGYSHVLLAMTLSDAQDITLVRALSGGPIFVFEGHRSSYPNEPATLTLSERHNSEDYDNLSRFLLRDLRLDSAQLRKNSRNAKVSLSFRNLARFCIVDETSMQAEHSPVVSGQSVQKTTEQSAFKLLIEGEDDSSLTPEPSEKEQNRAAGKAEALDELIESLEQSVGEEPPESLEARVVRLRSTIGQQTQSIAGLIRRRDTVVEAREASLRARKERAQRISEIREMRSRFSLLRAQYESDLQRLEMVAEAGNLLGYFDVGVCVFCGAEVEHQDPRHHQADEVTDLAGAVTAEARRTRGLRDDLLETMADLDDELIATQAAADALDRNIRSLDQQVSSIETELEPADSQLTDLLALRSELERYITVYDQIDQVRQLRNSLAAPSLVNPQRKRSAPATTLRMAEFSTTLRSIATDWGFPEADSVSFDAGNQDVRVNDQLRSSRGKGMRAILHAAFSLALLRHSITNSSGHPGFCVLDSPLVTYRDPDGTAVPRDASDEAIADDVAARFFRALHAEHLGQVLVLENTDPPDDVLSSATTTRFTKNLNYGRYGFFPV